MPLPALLPPPPAGAATNLARRRVGVALLLDPSVADEVDGLRRALGDPAVGRIPAHVTLVRPLNLRADDLPSALARLRSAAAGAPPELRLTLGAPATFAPVNPVLYLTVGGDLPGLRSLRDAVLAPPLDRPSPWPWVPHVTLGDGLPPERIGAVIGLLDRYAAVACLDRVVLLEEQAPAPAGSRRWVPLADAALGPPAVGGRGGVELVITRGRVLGPDAASVLAEDGAAPPAGLDAPRSGFPKPIVLTATRSGVTVGAAAAWWEEGAVHAGVIVGRSQRGQGIGGQLLAHLESALHAAGWDGAAPVGRGPTAFFQTRSRWVRPAPGTEDRSGTRT
ncbi:MAG: 2'-5' RNA ligase family protein [Acidimicrobiales bacterium]